VRGCGTRGLVRGPPPSSPPRCVCSGHGCCGQAARTPVLAAAPPRAQRATSASGKPPHSPSPLSPGHPPTSIPLMEAACPGPRLHRCRMVSTSSPLLFSCSFPWQSVGWTLWQLGSSQVVTLTEFAKMIKALSFGSGTLPLSDVPALLTAVYVQATSGTCTQPCFFLSCGVCWGSSCARLPYAHGQGRVPREAGGSVPTAARRQGHGGWSCGRHQQLGALDRPTPFPCARSYRCHLPHAAIQLEVQALLSLIVMEDSAAAATAAAAAAVSTAPVFGLPTQLKSPGLTWPRLEALMRRAVAEYGHTPASLPPLHWHPHATLMCCPVPHWHPHTTFATRDIGLLCCTIVRTTRRCPFTAAAASTRFPPPPLHPPIPRHACAAPACSATWPSCTVPRAPC
jgi:hypothetical protein